MLPSPQVLAKQLPEHALAKINIDYQTFTLSNGLTTIVHTDRSVPNIYVGVWYKVGSKNEPEGKTGFAHLFEHLMFQSTIHRDGEYFVPFNKAGAVAMNGTTNLDRTNYYQTVPSNAIDLALWMESDRMGYLGRSITQELLDEQRAVVQNEKRQGQLRPGSQIYEHFLKTFYPKGHPYDHTTIGSMEDLNNASLDDVKQWFNDAYGATNAVLVLSGDIDVATAKEKVAHYFSDVPAGKPMDKITQWIPELSHNKQEIVYDKVANISLSRVWALPNSSAKDTVLMNLVADTLAGGKNTPLYDVLVDEKQLATEVWANVDANDVSSTFSLDVTLKPNVDPEEVNRIIAQTLQTFFKKGPKTEQLEAINLGAEVSLLRSMESNQDVGAQLITGLVHHNDPLFVNKQRQWIGSADSDDVRTVAKKWLDKPYYEIRMLPEPTTQVAEASVDRSKMPQVGKFNGKITMPPIHQMVLDNGMKVVVAERHNLPLVDVSMQFDTGSLADKFYAPGTAEQAFSMLTMGTDEYNMNELSKKLDSLAVTIHGTAGKQRSGVNWSSLASNLDDAFALAAEVIRHPSYPQVELDKVISNIDSSYDNYELEPLRSARDVYGKAIWGGNHPFGHIVTRTEAKQINRDTIKRFHEHELAPNNATLYLVGDITLPQATKLANKYFGNWDKRTPSVLPEITAAQGQVGKVILVDAPGAVQSSISVGHTVAAFEQDKAAIQTLMDSALGRGFNSRLNMNLREDKGWAYGFSGRVNNTPTGPRVFTASGTVQTDKTAAAMSEIKREISEFIGQRPQTEAELARDKSSIVHSIPQGFTNNDAYLQSMINSDYYQQPYTRVEGAAERLADATLTQTRDLAKATYKPDELTWVIVGDLSKVEAEVRALKLGPVEVWDVYGNKLR
ncbi:insulinase family protein [Shewanella sp. C32]|uniref:Insulinase family protein n=1 Tax=Shewanella electrica TaxID=515560 RepID=A0ABT2FL11_9GAMM|nr:pitrilysin family protein [Shewanella electrica]MCH1923804.1 insulinase family protein [Shewanella electrica]MCS4557022.1 insulinase family protein [Shewanella electrica]